MMIGENIIDQKILLDSGVKLFRLGGGREWVQPNSLSVRDSRQEDG